MVNLLSQTTVAGDSGIYTAGETFGTADPEGTMLAHELVARQATLRPASLAVQDGKRELTYLELDQRANRLARHIRALGVGPNIPVALYFEPGIDFVVAALAVLKAGGPYVPLDSTHPPLRLADVMSDAGVRLVLSHRRVAANLPAGSWEVVDLDVDECSISEKSSEPLAVGVEGCDLAYIIYTSGSTGRPKGVEITHANLLHLIRWHQRAFSITSSDRASQIASLAFDAAVWEVWSHLTAGASLHIIDEQRRRSPEGVREWLLANRITITFVPPIFAEQLIASDWPAETNLRILLTGADTLHRRPKPGLPFVLVNNYGPTECTVVVTSGVVKDAQATTDAISIGRSIDGTRVLILDEDFSRVPSGVEGEICISGPHVGRGYRNLPELTLQKFILDPATEQRLYRTGDRGRELPDGEIEFLGRIDDQIKIRGFRIEPGEVTAHLNSYPGISTSTVIAYSTDAEDKLLVAYLVLERGHVVTSHELRHYLQTRVPDYMIPARFVQLSSLPVTANGKCDKRALPPPGPNNLLPDAEQTETSNQSGPNHTTTVIASLVSGLLEGTTINTDDNFFLIGGHSLLAAQLLARLRETFAVTLSLRQLFEAPTVTLLAEVVNRKRVGK